MRPKDAVPESLRRWFVVHFVADLLFAVPMIVAPEATLRLFGWHTVDPVTTRLVGAALVGIGGQSLLGRGEGREVFHAMLTLKCLWSGAAVVGLATSLAQGAPAMTWAFLAIFLIFAAIWNYYRVTLARPDAPAGSGPGPR
jgi:hypothetical protein